MTFLAGRIQARCQFSLLEAYLNGDRVTVLGDKPTADLATFSSSAINNCLSRLSVISYWCDRISESCLEVSGVELIAICVH